MKLGARPETEQITGLILKQGLSKGGIGVVLGLIGGAALLSSSMPRDAPIAPRMPIHASAALAAEVYNSTIRSGS